MSNETEAAPAGSNSPARPSAARPLRVWPGVLLVVLVIVARFAPAYLEGGLAKYWMVATMGPMVCCLLLVIWWLAASRVFDKSDEDGKTDEIPHRNLIQWFLFILSAMNLADDNSPVGD